MKIPVEPPLDLPIKVHGRKFTTNLCDSTRVRPSVYVTSYVITVYALH